MTLHTMTIDLDNRSVQVAFQVNHAEPEVGVLYPYLKDWWLPDPRQTLSEAERLTIGRLLTDRAADAHWEAVR